MTNELRAKFEEWWEENYFYVHEKLASLKEYAWMGWQAAHASRDAEVEALKRDAERYRALEKLAQKQTAYDRYGNGAYWTIGLFSDDSRMTFVETIDAAMAK